MMTQHVSGPDEHLWSVILAGGEGERTRDFVQARLGHHKPKQYCAFVGTRSLLQHTVDRADQLASPSHRVLVVGAHHRREVDLQLATRPRGKVLHQPSNRGTAPGVFLALSHIASRDPDATVAIYPADHFVCPERAFVSSVASAVTLSAERPEKLVLLGVRPRGPETEYGWVQPGEWVPSRNGVKSRHVVHFVEKPSRASATELLDSGGVWNTSVVVGKLATLWALGWRHLPEILLPWVRVGSGLVEATEEASLEDVYREMPVRDFSRELLEPAAGNLVVIEAKGFYWSDWGQPGRILETLSSLERKGGPSPRTALESSQPLSPGVLASIAAEEALAPRPHHEQREAVR